MKWNEIQSTGEMWTNNDRFFFITKLTDGYIVVMMYVDNEDSFFTNIKIQAEDIIEDEEYYEDYVKYNGKNNFVRMIFTADYVITDSEDIITR